MAENTNAKENMARPSTHQISTLKRKNISTNMEFNSNIVEDIEIIPPSQEDVLTAIFGEKVGALKRKKLSTNVAYNKPISVPKVIESQIQPPQEEVLNTILKNQNKILENQNKMLQRNEALEKDMKENFVDNSVVMVNNHTTRVCKIILQKLHQSIRRLTGEDENELQIEIGATLPLSSIDAAQDVEEKLQKPEYLEAMKLYLLQLKGCKATVDEVFKKIMKDELIALFNFDGRKEKRSLMQLTLINKLLSDVFATEGRNSFEKELKKSVELSHNRFKQRKFAIENKV